MVSPASEKWTGRFKISHSYNYMNYKEKETICPVYFDIDTGKPVAFELEGVLRKLSAVRQLS